MLPEPSSDPDTSKLAAVHRDRRPKKGLSPREHFHPTAGDPYRHNSGKLSTAEEERDEKEKEPPRSWHARGYDYPANFTMNFCGPVVEEEPEAPEGERTIVGRPGPRWENVSAFYVMDDRTFSLG